MWKISVRIGDKDKVQHDPKQQLNSHKKLQSYTH